MDIKAEVERTIRKSLERRLSVTKDCKNVFERFLFVVSEVATLNFPIRIEDFSEDRLGIAIMVGLHKLLYYVDVEKKNGRIVYHVSEAFGETSFTVERDSW